MGQQTGGCTIFPKPGELIMEVFRISSHLLLLSYKKFNIVINEHNNGSVLENCQRNFFNYLNKDLDMC